MSKYRHRDIENRWKKRWMKEKIYSPDSRRSKKPFYNLWMFPYPSAEGLHAGHVFASAGSDVYGRFMRMKGKDVFQPIGYDSFGIHSENFAMSISEHPEKMLSRTTKYYEKQLKEIGHGYDWTKTVTTSKKNYYVWTQWVFTTMFKAGLAYRKEASVNWCPSCKTVLADEQVIAGECERCGQKVKTKVLKQWFFRITDYAEKLLGNLEKINWPEKIKLAQKNWIGRSEGVLIDFRVQNSKLKIKSFTTRPDTLYGATFFVISPEHPNLGAVTTSKYRNEVQRYIDKAKKKSKEDRISEKEVKSGVKTGGLVINPATGKEIPVYIADYVLMDYGTGAIMGVPGHDERDWSFAKKYKLDIVEVISGGNVKKKAYEGEGKIVNSGRWNGLEMPRELDKVINEVKKKNWGKSTTTYHLRDWLISRQRYWGPPIPMIFCQACEDQQKSYFTSNKGKLIRKDQSDWNHAGWYSEEKLPVELPYLANYQPKGTGRGPLADHPEFYQTKCPECGGDARKETDVSDTFLDSSWYFLRYPSVGNKRESKLPWEPEITKKWLPVNLYFGGAEHAVLHLMYSRFVTQVFYDLKMLHFDEPFPKLFAHGLMIKDGAKMSKSRGNVVNPDKYVEKFGADALRLYLMFMGPMDGYPDFRDTGIEGMRRFVDRIWELYKDHKNVVLETEEDAKEVLIKLHQTIKKVTEDVEKFHYNTAISAIMEFVNLLREKAMMSKSTNRRITCAEWDEALSVLTQLLAPFAPFLSEEVWVGVLNKKFSVHTSSWPQFEPELVKEDTVTFIVQVNGKLRATFEIESKR